MSGAWLKRESTLILLALPAMPNPSLAPEEQAVIRYKDSAAYKNSRLQRQIARELDASVFGRNPDHLVLTHSFNAFEIIINSRYPDRFVNTTDRDFKAILEDPFAHEVSHILVPPPGGLSDINAVFARYPGFYEERYEWTELERTLDDGWKLFRVIGPSADESQ